MNNQYELGFAFTLLLATSLGATPGCGGDDDDGGDAPIINAGRAGSTSTGGSGPTGGTDSNGGTGETAGGNGDGGETPGEGGTGATAGSGNPGTDCFETPATADGDVQFLNRCTDSRCSPFDNLQRIPGFDGTLPGL